MDENEHATGRTKEGTFLAAHVDGPTAILSDVTDGEVLTLSAHPDLTSGDVIDGTVEAEPPMEATWRLVDIDRRRTIPVEHVDLDPTGQVREAVEGDAPGTLARIERAGRGEIHAISVEPGTSADAAEDVVADAETVARAARLDVDRVEVRAGDGVVSVRYLPD